MLFLFLYKNFLLILIIFMRNTRIGHVIENEDFPIWFGKVCYDYYILINK